MTITMDHLLHTIEPFLPRMVHHFLHARIIDGECSLRVGDWRAIAWFMIGVGMVLRIIPYLHNRSFWLDEAMLAISIVKKPYSELLGLLEYMQMAPVGFLFLEKAMLLNFGNSEYVLRLYPLLAGIVSLFLFYGVVRRILSPRAATISLSLFAISESLIRYSSNFKPYSSDVAIALGIYLLGLICLEKESKFFPSLFFLSILGAISIWFSYPAIFSLAGVGIALTLYYLHDQKWNHLLWLAMAACLWLGSFTYNYFTTLVLSQTPEMVRAWITNNGFMPLPPMSLADIMWFPTTFFSMFRYPGSLSFYGLAVFCFLLGWMTIFFANRYAWYILTLPFLFTLLANALHMYPFHSRLILFLVPAMLIFVVAGVEHILNFKRPTGLSVGVILCVLLFMVPVQKAISTGLNPARMVREEPRAVITYLKKHFQNNDKLYLYSFGKAAFEYYANKVGLEGIQYQRGIRSEQNWDKYVEELQGFRGNDRVWFFFTHVMKTAGVDEEKLFLHILNGMGTQLDSFIRKDASIYLYDLSVEGSS